ncbi:MAG: DMT family transporter [Thermoplasmata archaeon]
MRGIVAGSRSWVDYGIYALLCVVWGSTWLAIKIGLVGAPPFLSASLRFVIAAAILIPLSLALGAHWPKGHLEWSVVAFVGIVMFIFDYGLIYWAEASGVESALAAVLFATMPFQTALMAHGLIRQEKLTAKRVVGIAMGFGGIVLVFSGEMGGVGVDKALPMLAIVLSATCASAASVAMKRWGHDASPYTWNAVAMAIGATGLMLLSLSAREPLATPGWPEGILSILYLAVLGTVVTFVGYLRLLKTIPVTTMSFIAFITPIVAVFLGYAVASETLDPVAGVGAAITLGGIVVYSWKRRIPVAGSAEAAPATMSPGPPEN